MISETQFTNNGLQIFRNMPPNNLIIGEINEQFSNYINNRTSEDNNHCYHRNHTDGHIHLHVP